MTRKAWKNTKKQYELIYIASWRTNSSTFLWSSVERIGQLTYSYHGQPEKDLRLFFTLYFKSGQAEDIEFPCSRLYKRVTDKFLGFVYNKMVEKDIKEYWACDEAIKAKKVLKAYRINMLATERHQQNLKD